MLGKTIEGIRKKKEVAITLKDLENEIYFDRSKGHENVNDVLDDVWYTLRELASRYIEELQKIKDSATNIADKIIADRKIEWITMFFNLEED